jgi:predicted transcriptional regulator
MNKSLSQISKKKTRTLVSLREEMRAVARGEIKAPPRPAATICSALSSEAITLYQIILQNRPETIGGLVELTGRAQPNISRTLQRLSAHRIVELVKVGREVKPVPLVDRIGIDLVTGTYETHRIPAPAA